MLLLLLLLVVVVVVITGTVDGPVVFNFNLALLFSLGDSDAV